jgi:hypothetical protein
MQANSDRPETTYLFQVKRRVAWIVCKKFVIVVGQLLNGLW